ncbi:MAG: dihydroxyacetone kinase subunit L [Propionibacteriaceae bacterium]|jgi:dihydroxyacetone kinase-like protein|nr:dihydroxyacetone kinase subunit L [Propionibacteriaceae bacterium]
MAGELTAAWAVAWMRDAAGVLARQREELIELDRAIGDGDHGENMDRGFQAVVAGLDASAASPKEVLSSAGRTLISTVGGAAGPLYGTALMRAGQAAKERIDADNLVAVLSAALEGVQARGKAQVGDKTMVDAWSPAVEAARQANEGGATPLDVLRAAASAAEQGAEATVGMVARKGRASYLGERSVGHQDPGATSTAHILQSAAKAAAA